MIVDTNGLSAWADGAEAVRSALRRSTRPVIPAIVLGEYRYGIIKSNRFARYQDWLRRTLPLCAIHPVTEVTAEIYGRLRAELERRGTPLPLNDIWIAAIALELDLPLLSNDSDFDRIEGLVRIGFDDPRKKDHKPLPKA
ncbi:hypothetical protein AXK11_09025 [Cephaloticoccus primus]|uniref:Ribonuclease VapC n=1 Tax=Cephaloticoccus primus TaxID=1548207 RepID=A0A139SHQ1_9BACT|nr:type II toxin-antitoxin system VapC family toxin [Cephaloticoccus primus]KXU34063.1 hypothetical protein AXK11_09025 [Cephaloticoccus primus]